MDRRKEVIPEIQVSLRSGKTANPARFIATPVASRKLIPAKEITAAWICFFMGSCGFGAVVLICLVLPKGVLLSREITQAVEK